MDIVYAAEKSSIADLLGTHLHCRVAADELEVFENPAKIGSFFVRWQRDRFVLAPNGELIATRPWTG